MVVELEMDETQKPEIQKTEFVWMNGKTIAWEDGNIPLMTHALHYGTGGFEGIRGYGQGSNMYILRLQDHFERLINSARVRDIETKTPAGELMEACLPLIR